MQDHDFFIKIKYYGEETEGGIMDAKSSAEALLGFDNLVRRAVLFQIPELKKTEFEIPVKIQEGSWEIVLPWLQDVGVTFVILKYLYSFADIAAKEGLLESGPIKDTKKILKWSGKAIQWFIKIVKHTKTFELDKIKLGKRDFDQQYIEIINQDGEILKVPIEFYKFFESTPSNIMEKNAHIIRSKREMSVITSDNESINVTNEDRVSSSHF